MTILTDVKHVSPCCVKLNFDGPLRNNADLRNIAHYTVPGRIVTAVVLPASQDQVYDASGSPVYDGGAPEAVYLLLDAIVTGTPSSGMTTTGHTTIVDFDGTALGGSATATLTTYTEVSPEYWTSEGLRTRELFRELAKEGRMRFDAGTVNNHALAHMIGKLNDLMSGALFSYLGAAIDGPAEPTHVTGFSSSGYSYPTVPTPGIGSTLTFKDGTIPPHIDKLWGSVDGSNTTFRASIPYHPFACIVLVVKGASDSLDDGIIETTKWFAPNTGDDRQLRLVTAPAEGASVLAIYIPKKSLVKIGKELISYEESDIYNGTAVIYGRAQIMSELSSHQENDMVEDVWCSSFVTRCEINSLAFGASGRALEYIALDSGSPRSDNPALDDTELRRMIFHTSVNMRGTPGNALEAIRYIYPRTWPNIIVDEDPRWSGCLVIWYDDNNVINDTWSTSPNVEPWETWLDHISWLDGMPTELMGETYYRDDAVDDEFYGDYFLDDFGDDPSDYPYPVVLGGSVGHEIGTPSDVIPPPLVSGSTIDTTYRSKLVRPSSLDKVLPIGCGVLILDITML